MADLSRTVAIVGAAESDEIGRVENKSSLQHHAEAAYNALEDAGLKMSDVDGLLSAGFGTLTLAEYLGIEPTYTDSTAVGGSSFIIHIAHAMAAINAGYCEVALVTHGEAGRSARSRAGGNASEPGPQFESPVRIHWRADQLRDGRATLHAPVWRGLHQTRNGRSRGGHSQVGEPQPEGVLQGHPDVVRGVPRLSLDRVALPPA